MQKLSAALRDLASRVKRVEDSAAAVEANNRAKLQARREELAAAIDESQIELAAAATQTKESARTQWSKVKRSIEGQVDEMRADFAKWQTDIKEDRAERAAEDAEYDAVVAVNLATYCLDAAEWAVVQAELARGEVDQLAARR
jgi:hypothetical protein